MIRRSFLAGTSALFAAALSMGGCTRALDIAGAGASRSVRLNTVRRLRVEHTDPLGGRCQYVAITDSEAITQPVFHASTGDTIDLWVENRLPQPTTVHFHGLTLNEANDGAGFEVIAPGATRRIRFPILNRAGLYWVHPHTHGFTAEQVHAGLVALLVVHDHDDAALDSALEIAPDNRLALALADGRVAQGQRLPYTPRVEDCLEGWYGNQCFANGEANASYPVSAGWARLQLLNASNARGWLLQFERREAGESAGQLQPFYLLGTDGGLLDAPVKLDRVFFYPAERIDIALPVSPGVRIEAMSVAFDPRHQVKGGHRTHSPMGRGTYPPLSAAELCTSFGTGAQLLPGTLPDGAAMRLFGLVAKERGHTGASVANTPTRNTPSQREMPSVLPSSGGRCERESTAGAPGEPAVRDAIEPTRRMRLDFSETEGFLIDNLRYQMNEEGLRIRRGAREIWEIRASPLSMPHPMHLHGFQFRVLRRQGTFGPARALANQRDGRLPTDLGFKDTVVLWPNETLWIEVDFSLPGRDEFLGPQRYMFHCHNLEHEDAMMMRNVTVL